MKRNWQVMTRDSRGRMALYELSGYSLEEVIDYVFQSRQSLEAVEFRYYEEVSKTWIRPSVKTLYVAASVIGVELPMSS